MTSNQYGFGITGVLRPTGVTVPNSFYDEFDIVVGEGQGDLVGAYDVLFGPDGNLYVHDAGALDDQPAAHFIRRYDGVTGAPLGDFIPVGNA